MWLWEWLARRFRVDQSPIVRHFIEPLESRRLLSYGATLQYQTWPQTLTADFNVNVEQLLTSRKVTFENVTTDTPVALSDPVFSADGKSATFTFPQAVSFAEVTGALPDGWSRVVVSSEDVPATVDLVSDFVFRTGDTNSDGTIDLDDFSAIEGGFLLGLTGYLNGDFNYSGGTPDLDDFSIIEGAFLTTLYPPPTGPNEITASALSDSSLILNWADTVTGEAGWRVQRSLDNQTFEVYQNLDPDTTNLTVTGLPDGTRTWWRVRAFGNGQDTAYTPKKGATTALASPTLGAITVDSSGIHLTWETNSANHVAVRIDMSTDEVEFAPVATLDGSATDWTLPNPISNTHYSFRMVASNAATDSMPAAADYLTAPGAPRGFSAKVINQHTTQVSWQPVNGLSGYTLEWKQSTQSTWSTVTVPAMSGGFPTLSYFLSGANYFATEGVQFDYRLTATNT
ncbi:MAG: hypothetical protein ACREJC_01470, partial [Tepidisphaeraceae bacterium]